MESTPVLIVGGGLVGLSASLFLAWRGVPCVLVERHPGSSPHPRAIGYTARTLELLRAVGLEERIPPIPANFQLRRARVESLAGTWFEESPWTPERRSEPRVEQSPCRGAAVAQDWLEPLLRERAISLGADIRLETELRHFEQDATGVTATLRRRDGSEATLRAAYVIAADGHRSPVREALEIGRSGRGHMRTVRSVLFRAPLDAYLQAGVRQFQIEQPGLDAFLTTYGDGRWVLIFSDDDERDEATLRTLVSRAIGRTDVDIELLTTGRWELSALIADRFAAGRIFLAGDAAHTLPPSRGGYGANTGIDDAHNLAWKLAAVLSGTSGPALLDTYDAERRPIAWLRHDQIFARPDYRAEAAGVAQDTPIFDDDAMEFGQLYRSTAVLGAAAELPPARRPEEWAGQPGTRAPHLWVRQDEARRSTLDLLQRGWVLFSEDPAWASAATHAAQAVGLPVACLHLGTTVQPEDLSAFRTAYGVSPRGATLIRPDGYIAWRAMDLPASPAEALTEALATAACAAPRVSQPRP
ncbi:FAD-dependent oxidoreductase [Corallococcus sp. M34]|uniref:FAD-dependent oxidoreductase n=1 Tax=Citreicoccus inhibens TaxID=2849499 RepID=UPI001C21F90B|nr:FAD-dependent oxidoreductase [Citreicoccus inhibens]MBU8899109.1 FAD-dependent oxidoreductase [Citreicoccus inhibens]